MLSADQRVILKIILLGIAVESGASGAPGLPNHLKAWRLAAGLTQKQIEKILGWQHARISHLELGEAVITDQVLTALAPYYGCEPADLLRGPPPDKEVRAKTREAADAISLLQEAERSLRKLRDDFQRLKAGLMPRLEELDGQIAALNDAANQLVTNAGETGAILLATAALLQQKEAKKKRRKEVALATRSAAATRRPRRKN